MKTSKTMETLETQKTPKDQTLQLGLVYAGFSTLPEGRFYILQTNKVLQNFRLNFCLESELSSSYLKILQLLQLYFVLPLELF